MAINEDVTALHKLLACPWCKGAFAGIGTESLTCIECERSFATRFGIPDIRIEAEQYAESGLVSRIHYALLGNPRVYNFQQAHFGAKPVVDVLRRELAGVRDATVLDIGAGTGVVAELLSDPTAQYVWLDNDEQKLRGLISRNVNCVAALGDAGRLPLQPSVVDVALMVEVSHHIPDDALLECLTEAARVTRGTFLFIDAVRGPRLRSKLMWQLDLGRHPRSEPEILEALVERFSVDRLERFRGVNHDHLMCVCAPSHIAVG